MLTRVTVLETLETYYDTVPRAAASAEEAGPFTLFVKTEPTGWPYYARPRLGGEVPFTAAAVDAVRERQRDLGVPEALERVHETTPTLLSAARESGLHVHECPLLVLLGGRRPRLPALPDGLRVDMLAPDSPTLGAVLAAVGAASPAATRSPRATRAASRGRWSAGCSPSPARTTGKGPSAEASHSPRGTTTELAGIAVVPRARRLGVGAAITHALVEDARRRGVGDGVPSPPRTTPSPGSTSGSASSGSARRASRSPRTPERPGSPAVLRGVLQGRPRAPGGSVVREQTAATGLVDSHLLTNYRPPVRERDGSPSRVPNG